MWRTNLIGPPEAFYEARDYWGKVYCRLGDDESRLRPADVKFHEENLDDV